MKNCGNCKHFSADVDVAEEDADGACLAFMDLALSTDVVPGCRAFVQVVAHLPKR